MRKAAALALLCVTSAADARGTGSVPSLVDAISADDPAATEVALAAKADPNAVLPYGETPLARAVVSQDAKLVEALLRHRARPDVADASGLSPLALACELGDGGIVAQLLDAGADVRRKTPEGASPLAICARFAPAGTVARMLALGAPVDSADLQGQTPLMWAASSGDTEKIGMLVKAGADVNRVDQSGFTPLFFAIKSLQPEAAKVLIAAGADAAHRGPENTSAAQLAAYQHNWKAAALLVGAGANLEERDRNGYQLLHAAAAGGDVQLVSLLLARGAAVDALTGPSRVTWVTEANFGVAPAPVPPMTALLIAAENGHADVMRALVAAGADTQFVARDGANVAIAAAKAQSALALEYALTLAPDVNVRDAQGLTPLHHVLLANMHMLQPAFESMLQVLARHGARTDIPMNKGAATAADIAEKGLASVRAIFEKVFAGSSTTAVKPSTR